MSCRLGKKSPSSLKREEIEKTLQRVIDIVMYDHEDAGQDPLGNIILLLMEKELIR